MRAPVLVAEVAREGPRREAGGSEGLGALHHEVFVPVDRDEGSAGSSERVSNRFTHLSFASNAREDDRLAIESHELPPAGR